MRLVAVAALWSVALLFFTAALYAAWASLPATAALFGVATAVFAVPGWFIRLSTPQRLTALMWASGALGAVFLVLGLAYGTAAHLGAALVFGVLAGAAFLGAKKTSLDVSR